MADTLALTAIVLAGIYLLWLAGLAFAAPSRATRFLGGFASSAPAHYLELAIRLAIGLALLRVAPRMACATLFAAAGWIVVVTTTLLLLVPWRWHHALATRAVPLATSNLKLFALGSALLGGFVLWSAFRGPA